MNNTTPLPKGPPTLQREPRLSTCEVGPFRLKGVKIDVEQFTPEQITEMAVWCRENNGYVVEETGLFSWKNEAKRDWFILRWS